MWTLNFWGHVDTKLFPALASFKFSLVLTILIILTMTKTLLLKKFKWRPRKSDLVITLAILATTLFPLLSAIPSFDKSDILSNPAYKSLLKHLAIFSLVASSLSSQIIRKSFITANIVGVIILAIILHVRFFIFQEARADGRPFLDQNIADPNFLACIFASFIPIATFSTLDTNTKYKYPLTIIICLFLLESVLLTGSRMGIIALGFSLISLTRLLKKNSPHSFNFYWLAIALGSLFFVFLLFSPIGQQVIQRFNSLNDESNNLRIRTLQAGISVFADAPILGVGIDGVKDVFLSIQSYARLHTEAMELNVHNTFIKLLAEYGIIGFTLFLVLPVQILLASFGMRLSKRDKIYLQSSIIALTANSLTLPLDIQDWLYQTIGCFLVFSIFLKGSKHEKNWT